MSVPDYSDLLARCLIAKPSTMDQAQCDLLTTDLNYLEEMYLAEAIQLTQTQLDALATVRGRLELRLATLNPRRVKVEVEVIS